MIVTLKTPVSMLRRFLTSCVMHTQCVRRRCEDKVACGMVSWGVEGGLAWTVQGAARLSGAVGRSATVAVGWRMAGCTEGLPMARSTMGSASQSRSYMSWTVCLWTPVAATSLQPVRTYTVPADGGGSVYSQRVQSARVLQVFRYACMASCRTVKRAAHRCLSVCICTARGRS